jgi:hypothetical protein
MSRKQIYTGFSPSVQLERGVFMFSIKGGTEWMKRVAGDGSRL